VLALWLTRLGVRVRIIDKTSEPGTTSRALAVHARTLEFYRQLGLADEVVARGRKMDAVNMWAGGKQLTHVVLGDIGRGISPYPYVLIFPQDEHERLLIERLEALGVAVERRTELVGFDDTPDGIVAQFDRDGEAIWCEATFLAGCDGAHSFVRESCEIGFPGGTYEQLFYVADVDARGPAVNGELHVALDSSDFLAVFPHRQSGRVRLIGTVQQGSAESHDRLEWADVGTRAIASMRLEVERVNWLSAYRVHHRVADQFRAGRAFLVGDSAHIHSPVGGQGMNTGIGDASNLAWKLAAVLRDRANESILDTYEPERISFARRLVDTTDRAFAIATADSWFARFMRVRVVPRLAPVVSRRDGVRQFAYRTVSQTALEYRSSALSEGRAGDLHGGDRLRWVTVDDAGADNFAPLASLDWQVHVYGTASADLAELCRRRALALHVFPWKETFASAGVARDALYLVRPDGYVGLAAADRKVDLLASYLDKRGWRRR
jgi:2-polyprenyl-6-methoxyphenol hydroxylase-like FAD-dependent oxidoreductase